MMKVMDRTLTRRQVLAALAGLVAPHARGARAAQAEGPQGQLLFARAGDIYQWTPQGETKVIADGNASDPRWSPDGLSVLYVQSGGSYSNLVLFDMPTKQAERLTDNESTAQMGSPEYVDGSSIVVDPDWSASGLIGFASDMQSANGEMQLWLMSGPRSGFALAPTDGSDAGNIESVSISAGGSVAAFTVTDSKTTYVAMRDLLSGKNYRLADGPEGAYDPALSPDAQVVALTIRDTNGTSDLWLVERATGTQSRLTEGEQAGGAAWSPDGRWIAYIRASSETFQIKALPYDEQTGKVTGSPHTLVDHADIDATSGLSWHTAV